MHGDIQRILLSEEEIREGIDRLALEVTEAFRGSDLTVVSILKGSCIFASDLVRRLPIPVDLAFVAARSYRSSTVAGELELQLMPSEEDVVGRRVLLVDDILDTGRTLSAVAAGIRAIGARSVSTCVFLDKPARRVVEVEADHRCFEIENEFVVGYGLDFAGRYRNLPYLGIPRQEITASAGLATE